MNLSSLLVGNIAKLEYLSLYGLDVWILFIFNSLTELLNTAFFPLGTMLILVLSKV